ncbi:TetR/AcrR family transcriptional regulator [Gordonia sp. NPDC058843]|uniref:TetR/AcrR family transcriptional regulator n=1 Tax=Gordonia sp. NPDC058843 TaxID=3346648 RepID=UPI00368572A3
MGRVADHGQRRLQIVGGVAEVARTTGLGSVTIARAAHAAGVSVGLVQHYYPSKEDLLIDTFTSLRAGVLHRIDAEIERAERRGARIEDMMISGLSQLLPLTPRRRDEVYLSHAFAGLALENEQLRQHLERAHGDVRDRIESALVNGTQCGEVDEETDAVSAAFGVAALTDGLAAQLLVRAGTAEKSLANAVLSGEVARLCPGECTRHGYRDRSAHGTRGRE